MTTFSATLVYDPNDGSPSWATTESDENEDGYGYLVFSLPTLSRTGYTFNGWLYNGSLRTGSTITLWGDWNGESYSVTASWTQIPVTYTITATVTFDNDGGTPSSTVDTFTGTSSTTTGYVTARTPLTEPTKQGYRFVGWLVQGVWKGVNTTFSQAASVSGVSQTYTALWQEIQQQGATIYSGGWHTAECYIWNGSAWEKYTPNIYDSTWKS